jgi:hypothetical protein
MIAAMRQQPPWLFPAVGGLILLILFALGSLGMVPDLWTFSARVPATGQFGDDYYEFGSLPAHSTMRVSMDVTPEWPGPQSDFTFYAYDGLQAARNAQEDNGTAFRHTFTVHS